MQDLFRFLIGFHCKLKLILLHSCQNQIIIQFFICPVDGKSFNATFFQLFKVSCQDIQFCQSFYARQKHRMIISTNRNHPRQFRFLHHKIASIQIYGLLIIKNRFIRLIFCFLRRKIAFFKLFCVNFNRNFRIPTVCSPICQNKLLIAQIIFQRCT